MDTVTNEDICRFSGNYEGSRRVPDLGIFKSNGAKDSLKWLLEVGFSETYEHVKEKIGFWLKGKPEVARVILIKITENLEYKCPLQSLTDESYQRLGFPQTEPEISDADFTPDNE